MPCDELDPRAYWLRKARAILSALKAAGLVIVPEEPTEKMMKAGGEEPGGVTDIFEGAATIWPGTIYRAMIRAATSPDAPLAASPVRRE